MTFPKSHIEHIFGKIRIANFTDDPQIVRSHEHFCQIRPIFMPSNITGEIVFDAYEE